MEVHGNLDWDDDHDEAANAVSWQLTENAAQRDGIFRQFRAATVFLNEPGQPLWMKVIVKPTVRFSADPRRLLPKNDHPVLLDGKTPLLPLDLKCDDFSADTFPWEKVLQLPLEYTVIDSLCKIWHHSLHQPQNQLTLQGDSQSASSSQTVLNIATQPAVTEDTAGQEPGPGRHGQ
jgi:hypothetical protein